MTAAQIGDEVNILQEKFNAPKAEVGKVIVGQDALVHRLLLVLLSEGHVLIEGVPGLAKTLAISTLADTLDVKFSRIQFTPDMLPGDITGTQIFNPKDGTYSVKRGPVFGNLVLADEINRAPAKVQAALLQAMQEGQVTLGDETMDLEEPFVVLATQNPIEQEGTYPLPEAQLDRFMLKVKITYPSKEDEIKVLDRMAGAVSVPRASKVMSPAEILAAREVVRRIFVDDKVKRYVVELVAATRDPAGGGMGDLENLIENGASVRASINLVKVAKANALLEGRSYISPHDVKSIAHDVLRHRILVTYEAEAEGKNSDDIIDIILDNVQVP
ncbi:MAG: AAA family ATPase [Gemmatimonadetes bacterium]|nr:AAA family ATPase [Gemmatimonadota bacterium]